MNKSNGSLGLIDFLRESTEAALDLSKNLTSAHSPGEFLSVWTRFAEGQYAAVEKYTCQLTGRTLSVMERRQAKAACAQTAAAASEASPQESENAALICDLHEQVEALQAQVTALTDKLTALEGRQPALKVKFAFGEPPHTGWTPSKVVVLGNDANGNLIELPSTIEEGGFRYTGTPSFWIAIG